VKYSLDIETLDTRSSAVVLSIGLCEVTREGVSNAFKINLDIQSQIDAGRTISSNTLQWWMIQDSETRNAAFYNPQDVKEALLIVRQRLSKEAASVFVKGPAFDAAILDDLAATFNVAPVCYFRRWRDIRTLDDVIEMAGNKDLQYAWYEAQVDLAPDRAHDARADAIGQGLLLSHFWRECST